MAKEVFMPKLSSTMETGTILQWMKNEGDPVEMGEPVFEVMSDKINIEVEAYEEGFMLKKYYNVDDVVPVNTVVGYIGEKEENVPDTPPESTEDSESDAASEPEQNEPAAHGTESSSVRQVERGQIRATPAARRVAREEEVSLSDVTGSGPKQRVQQQDVRDFLQNAPKPPKATPLARKWAEDQNVDLNTVEGSGPVNKIYTKDLSAAQEETVSSEPDRIPVKGVRKVVADRMAESASTVPHVTLNSDVDMTEAIRLRSQIQDKVVEQTGSKLSYTEIIMKAVAAALKRHPSINASLSSDQQEILLHRDINIGLAVATEQGLVVPVVPSAGEKGLTALVKESKQLAADARNQQLNPQQMQGGTFTISNLGMYAVDGFTPIINQPEAAILGVGQMKETPTARNGNVELRPLTTFSLSFDHRIVDGAPAAAFLTELKQMLEAPYELLM
ncbi:dihydrolipoamide acetyltransferase family protein [Salibacterium qingdaonense]|uniref:Dihydrolipoamide acetyltransferase component of pyruvate dehydrogenase complex n=1 Tax=Salibacterium qingdaonense TaxID=266892 RepID=A0A1I4IQT1_9BACI|nr:dihydrolipoamide acetyltransferase family protein [Salibacterium qingdaonense]SFL56106.1 pyruvate dehydrogenase E2 component (dihydrolipoamide acetyltransferase) [Salibacterium qingdaonense]